MKKYILARELRFRWAYNDIDDCIIHATESALKSVCKLVRHILFVRWILQVHLLFDFCLWTSTRLKNPRFYLKHSFLCLLHFVHNWLLTFSFNSFFQFLNFFFRQRRRCTRDRTQVAFTLGFKRTKVWNWI